MSNALRPTPGPSAPGVALGALVVVIAVKYVRRQRFIRRMRIARITPVELKRKLEASESLMIVDLRHSLDFDSDPVVIQGALHLSPEELEQRAREIPRDREIILYCT
jgi:hypothetical protein